MALFNLIHVDNFEAVRNVAPLHISAQTIASVRLLDEKDKIETWIQAILHDTNHTPHGPSEIADILTHKIGVKGKTGLAAFILKGKSFPTVRPSHVSHQIFRLERLQGLTFAIFGALEQFWRTLGDSLFPQPSGCIGIMRSWTRTTWHPVRSIRLSVP
jgi:hypothetical protein